MAMTLGSPWQMAFEQQQYRVGRMLDACARNDEATVSVLLQQEELSVDVCDDDGVTGLQMAAANGHDTLVCKLISWGANIELCNNVGFTALMHAAFHGHIGVLDALLQSGANPHTVSCLGTSALTLACRNGHVAMARELIDLGVDIESSSSSSDLVLTPVMAAALHNHEQCLAMLFTKGARVNRTLSQLSYTELMLAALYAQSGVVEQLLEHGADPNSLNKRERTALDLATEAKRPDIVALLAPRTCVKRTVSKKELRVGLVDAIKSGDMRRVRDIIQATPSRVNQVDAADGSTPLMHAAICGRVDMASLLVNKGADMNAQDTHSGWTALMQAVFHGYTTVAKYLVHSGADIHIRSHDGLTAFDLAMTVEGTDKSLLTLLANAQQPTQPNSKRHSHRHPKSNWSKITSKMFGRSCTGREFKPGQSRNWFSRVAGKFKKSMQSHELRQARQTNRPAELNGEPRTNFGYSWSTENSVFKDPLSVFGATQPRTFFRRCEDIVKIQEHLDGTEYASVLDMSDLAASPSRDQTTLAFSRSGNPPDLVTSINEAQRDTDNNALATGSAMNRFRKSLTNRRSLRAKYAAHVIDTNNQQLREKAAAVIEREKQKQSTISAPETSVTANQKPPQSAVSTVQFWAMTAPRGERDSNKPPDPLLAEKNAAMMVGSAAASDQSSEGPGRPRRLASTKMNDSAVSHSHTHSTGSTAEADSRSQKRSNDTEPAAVAPRIHVSQQQQQLNAKSPRLDGSSDAGGVSSDSSSSVAQHQLRQYKYTSSPLGTQRRRLPLKAAQSNSSQSTRPHSYQESTSHTLQVPNNGSQQTVNSCSSTSSPPLTPTRRQFVLFATCSEGTQGQARRLHQGSPSSGTGTLLSPTQHARSRSLNIQETQHEQHSHSHSTGYQSAGSSGHHAKARQPQHTLPACNEDGIESILREIQLQHYVELFYEQEIDLEAFAVLSDVDLQELGIDDAASRGSILRQAGTLQHRFAAA